MTPLSPVPDAIPVLPGLAALAGAYDGFVIDMWGVLHDGLAVYPGALDTLAALKAAGKRTLLLTNAPRRADALADQIAALGIAPALYGAILSSGEAAHGALARRDTPFYAALGRRYHLIGPAGDDSVVRGLDYVPAPLDEADFILNIGPWPPEDSAQAYLPGLRRGVERGLPMICANPDLVVIRDGRAMICAGTLARHYADLGGRVDLQGKPDRAIYREALRLLGCPAERTLCIGDGMPTDIAGAAAAGLDALLVTGGIHAEELGLRPGAGQIPDPARVAALAARFGLPARAAVAAFVW